MARQRRLVCRIMGKDTCNTLQFLPKCSLFCQCIGSRRPTHLHVSSPQCLMSFFLCALHLRRFSIRVSGLLEGTTWRYLRPSVPSHLLLSFPTNYLPTLRNAAMLSSLASQLPSVLSSFSSPAATSTAITVSAKQLAWQAAVYLAIALGIVICCPEPLRHYGPLPHPPKSSFALSTGVTAVISGIILLVWNDDWPALIIRRLKLEPVPSGRFIMKTRVLFLTICAFLAHMYLRSPARSHALVLFSPIASTLVQWILYYFTTHFPAFQRLGRAAATPRPQSDLPFFRRPRLRETLLAEPPLAMLRDSLSRVPPP